MRLREIVQLVESTSDPAFAVDASDLIVAWNQAAESFFGLSPKQALGQPCAVVVQGQDECGSFCTEDCSILQAARNHQPVRNFDIQMMTPAGQRWCNVSILVVDDSASASTITVHIARPIDVQKRLELVMRDYVVRQTQISGDQAIAMLSASRTPVRETDLTGRELQILRLLAKGGKTAAIAEQLHISPTTVNNHVAKVMRKLNAHSRLEAVRRAEHAGLL